MKGNAEKNTDIQREKTKKEGKKLWSCESAPVFPTAEQVLWLVTDLTFVGNSIYTKVWG